MDYLALNVVVVISEAPRPHRMSEPSLKNKWWITTLGEQLVYDSLEVSSVLTSSYSSSWLLSSHTKSSSQVNLQYYTQLILALD